MSNLSAFLHPVQAEEAREVIISKRFLGEDGRPVPFKIRPLTQEENNRLTKLSMAPVKGGRRGELLAGEYRQLTDAIMTLSGFSESPEELEEEAKN